MSPATQTFVVRLWRPGESPEGGPNALHGVVEHLGSGESHAFKNDGDLLDFLHERRLDHATVEDRGGESAAE